MLELQTELITNGLKATAKKFNLSVNRHPKEHNLVSFKYSQFASDLSQPAARQARGIVLDEEDNWAIICKAYDKFFNVGEPLGYSFEDVANWRAYEKLDGSLLMLYCYNNCWYFASNGRAWHEELHSKALPLLSSSAVLNKSYTYAFELIGPNNLHIVQYEQNSLVLLGVFNKGVYIGGSSLKEAIGWQSLLDTRPGLSAEGYVLIGPNSEMAKAKSADYVKLHRAVNSSNAKSIAKIIAMGEWSEVYAIFPAKLEQFKYMLDKLAEYELMFEKHFIFYSSQKECALAVKHLPIASAIFSVRAGKFANFAEWLQNNSQILIAT